MPENKKELFSTVRYKVRDFLQLSNNEYILLDVIYQLSNNPSNQIRGFCYATQTYLSTMVGITRSNLNKMIKRLEERGLLERRKVTKSKPKKTTITIYKTTVKWYNSSVLGQCVETAQQPVSKQHSNLCRNSTATCVETAHKNTYSYIDINKNIDSEASPVGITSDDLFFKNQNSFEKEKNCAKKEKEKPNLTLLQQNQTKAKEEGLRLLGDEEWMGVVLDMCGGWSEDEYGKLEVEYCKFHSYYAMNGNYLTNTYTFMLKKFAQWLTRAKHQFKGVQNKKHKIPTQPTSHHQIKNLSKESIGGEYDVEGGW